MMKDDESTDLLTRGLAEPDVRAAPRLVAPRRPLDDVIEDAIKEAREHPPERHWAADGVKSGAGRIYALGATDGPRFTSATWLHSASQQAG